MCPVLGKQKRHPRALPECTSHMGTRGSLQCCCCCCFFPEHRRVRMFLLTSLFIRAQRSGKIRHFGLLYKDIFTDIRIAHLGFPVSSVGLTHNRFSGFYKVKGKISYLLQAMLWTSYVFSTPFLPWHRLTNRQKSECRSTKETKYSPAVFKILKVSTILFLTYLTRGRRRPVIAN